LRINKFNEMKKKEMQTYTLDQLTDEFIGKKGTHERERFEFELKLDVLGYMIKKARK